MVRSVDERINELSFLSNILYLSYDGMTDPLGQSQVLPYLTGLAKRGYKIALISFEKPTRFKDHHLHIQSICKEAGIEWHPLTYTSKPPILSTLKDLFLLWRKVLKLQQEKTFQIVHCRSYLTALIGLRLKKKFGTRFLFDMRGFWADERIEGGIWNPKNPIFAFIYRFFKSREKELLKAADHTIVLTHSAKNIIHGWPNISPQQIPITVIPCCVDVEHFDPANVPIDQQQLIRKKLDISSETIVISYVGSLGTWYMLPEMLAFFRVWVQTYPDSVFLCLTGDDPSIFWKEVRTQQLPWEKVRLKSVSRPKMPTYLSISQYSLFFIRPVFSKKASSPTKQGEIMAMGIPLICNTGVGDTDQIVRDCSAGYLVDSFNDESYAMAVESIRKAPLDKEQIRGGAIRYFSLSKGVDAYEQVYVNLRNAAATH